MSTIHSSGKSMDYSELRPELIQYEGMRIEALMFYGETSRFWVGRSTGWRPVHIALHNSRALGGDAITKQCSNIRIIRRSRYE